MATWRRKISRRFHALDRKLIELAPSSSPRLDVALVRLTRSANHSKLWLGTAAVLALKKGPTRRGATRGLFAVAAGSVIANGVLKPAFPRPRPPLHAIPIHKGLVKIPSSSSFPSGHSASAFAFTTAVALESPAAGAVLLPVATAVAYSRVHTGVHWPSDVVAGAAIGSGIALATRHWWPVAASIPTALGTAEQYDRLADGAGILIFVNPHSGTGNDPAELQQRLSLAQIVTADVEGDVCSQLRAAVAKYRPRALGVVGGDGSVSVAATVAVESGLPLAVLGGGTLNHYARDTNAEEDRTLQALASGSVRAVDLGTVATDGGDPQIFVNTASLGGYPEVVRVREKLEDRIGKWPAAAISAIRVMRRATPMRVAIDGEPMDVWMIFIGNGRYRPVGGLPLSRESLAHGELDVRYLRADVRRARTKAAFAVATGTLLHSRAYERHLVSKVVVEVDEEASLATDGEVLIRGRRFEFAAAPAAMRQFFVD